MKHFDIAVLGAGPGGYIAALKAGQMGASVAVVEKGHLGGTCLNNGCIPSKALLAPAELMHRISQGRSLGVSVDGDVSFDWSAIQKRKDKVLKNLRGGIAGLFKARRVELFTGLAKIDSPGKVAVTDGGPAELFSADKIIVATGSAPIRIDAWPGDPNLVCTSDEALHWPALPKRLLIVGGGVIGCEFACMMHQYGVAVTVVEMLPTLLPGMEDELGLTLAKDFRRRGMAIHVGTKVESIVASDGGAVVTIAEAGQAAQTLEVDKVLVSIGRRPVTDEIGLENVGITTDRGFVTVGDDMRTSAADVYCIGDANGRCLLAHAASAQGVVAVENALGHCRVYDSPVPGAVYTFPEIGAVGLTTSQARQRGLPISIGVFPIGHLGKAMAVGHGEGFVKVVRHRETDELLGVHMLGHNATECIAAAGCMLHTRASASDLAEAIFAHPTISEAIKESAEDALGMALHLPPRKVHKITVG